MTDSLDKRLAAAERLRGFIEADAVIQGKWQGKRDGRETACLLAALHPVTGSSECPAWLMPQWCAKLLPVIDDGVAPDQVLTVARGLYERTPVWARLDDAGWERVRVSFLCRVIDRALASARPVSEGLACWPQVESACQQVKDALCGKGDLEEAWAEADAAAHMATSAAWAAARAARAAAARAARAAAARAAADAARAAADAAADAAWAAAMAAACLGIAHDLFAAMDEEAVND